MCASITAKQVAIHAEVPAEKSKVEEVGVEVAPYTRRCRC